MEHTSTPWLRNSQHIFSAGENGANICSISSPRKSAEVEYIQLKIDDYDFHEAITNAAFIVRAVNSHDELVTALEIALDVLKRIEHPNHWGAMKNKAIRASRAAIDNATKEDKPLDSTSI